MFADIANEPRVRVSYATCRAIFPEGAQQRKEQDPNG